MSGKVQNWLVRTKKRFQVLNQIDFQILVGPSGEIIREAAELGQEKLSTIREDMKSSYEEHERADGVYLPSSTWLIMARK